MDTNLEEKLREYCSIGDERSARALVDSGVDINSQNRMNGWSCLHWASKRNHCNLVGFLVARGADVSLKTFKQEKAIHLTTDPAIKKLLGCEEGEDHAVPQVIC